jgi:hypothetical protein
VTFYSYNKGTGNPVRLCINVDDTWYATNATYDSGNVDSTGGGTGINKALETITISRTAANWKMLNFTAGSTLSLGNAPAADLPNGMVKGWGFYNDTLTTDSIIQIIGVFFYSKS